GSPDVYMHGHEFAQAVAELDNIRAALAWTTQPRGVGAPDQPAATADLDGPEDPAARAERTELGLRIVGALDPYWGARGAIVEASAWTARILAQSDPARRTAARARVLTQVARLKVQGGQFAGLQDMLVESESIWRELGDQHGLAPTLTLIGAGLLHAGQVDAARPVLREAEALATETGDRTAVAFNLFALGNIELEFGDLARAASCLQRSVDACTAGRLTAFRTVPLVSLARVCWLQGEYARAQQMVEEGLAIRTALGGDWPIAGAQNSLADILRCQGDHAGATALAHQSLIIFRKLGDRSSTAWVLYTLGHTARQAGDYAQAIRYWTESLAIDRELDKDRDAVTCLAALACGYGAAGQLHQAATLFGAVDGLLARGSVRWSPADAATYRDGRAAVRETLGADLFQSNWARGHALPEADAVALALRGPAEAAAGVSQEGRTDSRSAQ
ncbi:MAG TPA: tetratricopeptide repeat protein, partial [Chloroflexia bacterium]|nr:tetratricopeptide repeat protein [Chloroflexia bacterium]